MRTNVTRFITSLILSLAVLISPPATLAYAADEPAAATEEAPAVTGTISIVYTDEEKGITGSEFSIYRVADVLPHGHYELIGPFAECDVELGPEMTNGSWEDAAVMLFEYANANGIGCDKSGVIDAAGCLTFADIATGLYLVSGTQTEAHATIYTPQVFCVAIPGRDDNNNEVFYVRSEPKFASVPVTPAPTATPELTPAPTPADGSDMPKTGDPNAGMLGALFIVAGMCMAGLAVVAPVLHKRLGRKED